MRLSNIAAGILILARYFEDPDGDHTGAEHDQFYVYDPDRPVSAEDAHTLEQLGWMPGDDGGWCFWT